MSQKALSVRGNRMVKLHSYMLRLYRVIEFNVGTWFTNPLSQFGSAVGILILRPLQRGAH